MKYNLFAYLIIWLSINSLSGQIKNPSSSDFYPNTILGHVGSNGYSFLAVGMSYERLILPPSKLHFSFWGRLRGGFWYDGKDFFSYYSLGFTTLSSGVNKHHLELHLGVGYLYEVSEPDPERATQTILPSFSLGYRYQIPEQSILFRAGIGIPEMFYLGVGTIF